MRECIFTIDLGTSGPKVALVALDSEVLGWEFAETKLFLLPDGGVEQNATDWYNAICQASRKLLSRKNLPKHKVIAVAVTSQWSGVVPVDRQAKPLHNAISWMDTRGAAAISSLMGGLLKVSGYDAFKLAQWLRITGGLPGLAGKDTLAHILYIKEEKNDIYQNTYKFLEPKDYLNALLTGRFVTARDCVTLYWLTDNRDSQKVHYHPYLLKTTGIDIDKLPEIVSSTDILGPLLAKPAKDLGLPKDIPVVVGTPDVHSAALGSGGIDDYDGHLYLGTSSWLTCHMPIRKVSPESNMATIPSALPGKYIIGNEQESAGFCLTHFAENILFPEGEEEPAIQKRPKDIYPWLNRIAETTPPGAGKVIFTPWLFGERTPVENKTIRGGFHNISGSTKRGHLARAVFEGVAFNSRWLMHAVEKFMGREFSFLRLIGGGASSDFWCQIHADVLNREIHRVAEPRLANIRGLALLAAHSLGKLTPDEMSQRVKIDKVFTPQAKNRQIYDELYTEFIHLYKAEKKIHERLNRDQKTH